MIFKVCPQCLMGPQSNLRKYRSADNRIKGLLNMEVIENNSNLMFNVGIQID
jgi:hypothetical protein